MGCMPRKSAVQNCQSGYLPHRTTPTPRSIQDLQGARLLQMQRLYEKVQAQEGRSGIWNAHHCVLATGSALRTEVALLKRMF